MTDWHTRHEKRTIELLGGEPTESYGPDGVLDGAPVEVRSVKKDDRFRLNRDTHETLLDEGGSYVFDDVTDEVPPVEIEADEVDDLLGAGDWFSDRGYEHRFLDVDAVIDDF
jgi:hypothetical protein